MNPLVAAAIVDIPHRDPDAAAWQQADEVVVTVLPQQVAYPRNDDATLTSLRVRALASPSWLAVRIQWDDPSKDDRLDVDAYTDAVAIELPLGEPMATNPMMGSPDHPVYIVHWKAVWQRDIDQGHHADVQDHHPGFYTDAYPFATLGFPYPLEESFESSDARRYLVAVSANNPVSRLHRNAPIEELHAEGFGSLADHRVQDSDGWGVYDDGVWTVVFAIPRVVEDPANPTLVPGATGVAFAVWDGDATNVGGRKHWFPFLPLELP